MWDTEVSSIGLLLYLLYLGFLLLCPVVIPSVFLGVVLGAFKRREGNRSRHRSGYRDRDYRSLVSAGIQRRSRLESVHHRAGVGYRHQYGYYGTGGSIDSAA